jgi:hypothetical protein
MLAPCSAPSRLYERRCAPALTAPARAAVHNVQAGTEERLPARTKELDDETLTTEEPAEVCERKRRDGGRSSRRLRTLVTLMALFEACPVKRSHAR